MHTGEFVEPDLNLEGGIAILLEDSQIFLANERNLLVRRLGAQDVAERYVLEPLGLTDVIVVGTTQQSEKCLGKMNLTALFSVTYMLIPAGMPEPVCNVSLSFLSHLMISFAASAYLQM